MTQPLFIGLHQNPWVPLFRTIAAGVSEAAAQGKGVHLVHLNPVAGNPPVPIGDMGGLISSSPELPELPEKVVITSNSKGFPGFLKVVSDDEAIGRRAAAHLLEAGVQHLAFFEWSHQCLSVLREKGFADLARERGVPCHTHTFFAEARGTWFEYEKRLKDALGKKLVQLPPRTGVFVANDERAKVVFATAEAFGLRIPEDFLLIGVDNLAGQPGFDELPLSSVEPDGLRIGQEALATLLQWIKEGQRPEGPVLIPPKGVVSRASTCMPQEGSLVERALRRIRESAYAESAQTLAAGLGVSRVTLHRQFIQELGKAPHQVIFTMKMEEARALLKGSHAPLEEIALQCGYTHASTFAQAFQKAHGQTPGSFRTGGSG